LPGQLCGVCRDAGVEALNLWITWQHDYNCGCLKLTISTSSHVLLSLCRPVRVRHE
jgi:hypothetical protein